MMFRLAHSFRCAFAGLGHVLGTEANMRLHLAATIVIAAVGIALDITATEWMAVIACVGAVWATECLNTAIETLADRVTVETDPAIRTCKDCAAGAVLAVSIASAGIGGIIFVPRLWELVWRT